MAAGPGPGVWEVQEQQSPKGLGVGWLWFSSIDAPEGGQQEAESFVQLLKAQPLGCMY